MHYTYLTIAIVLEVLGTSSMRASDGFTKPLPTIGTIVAFLACFYFLSIALKVIPLGLAYAIWAGAGIVLTALISVFIFHDQLDLPAIIGITLIVAGVVVMNLFSKTTLR